jgi:hypothetical protein
LIPNCFLFSAEVLLSSKQSTFISLLLRSNDIGCGC